MYNSTIKKYFTNLLALTTFLFFTFSSFHLDAQITINENVFTDWIGKKNREVQYETNLNIDGQLADIKAAVGPDQIWDFSNLNYVDSTVIIFELMVIDPNDPHLANPELVSSQYIQKVTLLPVSGGVDDTLMTYIYTSFEDNKWTVNGSFTLIDLDLDGVLDSILQFFVPPSLQVPFPVTSTSMWYDSTNLVTVFEGMEFVGSINLDSTWAQGYGTLITPYGTAEALRLHNKDISWSPFLPVIEESNDYNFVTEDDMISAIINVEDGRAFYNVRTVIEGPSSTFDLDKIKLAINNVSPNPFSNELNVKVNILEAGEVEFRLVSVDANITSVLKKDYLSSGLHNIQLSTRDFPAGIYFLEVRSGRYVQHMTINKI